MAKSSQIWVPRGTAVRWHVLSPQQPMATPRQSMYLATGDPWRQYMSPSEGGGCEGCQDLQEESVVQPALAGNTKVSERPVILELRVVSPGEQRFTCCPPLLLALRE
eukprot:1193142-Amphidinium_carterae.1